MIKIFASAILFFSLRGYAQNIVLRGELREMGTRKPISDANIFLLPSKKKATTNSKGEFQFEEVDVGTQTWVVNLTGYLKLEKTEDIKESNSNIILYIEKENYMGLETTIFGKVQKRDDTTRSLKLEQASKLPGAGDDPVKAVQNLPGVNRSAGVSSQIIIQGSAPKDTKYSIDQHPVPLVFHFGGFSSVTFPESLDQIDYLSAGYGPEYGRAIGGHIALITRKPKTDRYHFLGSVDTARAGLLLEGPVDESSSFLVSARYSYIGYVLKALFKGNDQFNLTVAPTFADTSGLYAKTLSDSAELKVFAIGSQDKLQFLFNEPLRQDPSIRGEFYSETSFYRLIPQLQIKHGDNLISRYSAGVGRDFINFKIGDNFFDLKTFTYSVRGEGEKEFESKFKTFFGFDNEYVQAEAKLRVPSFYSQGGVSNPISSGELREQNIFAKSQNIGLYSRNEIPLGDWTFSPSIRLEYFSFTKEWLPEPRGAIKYSFDKYSFLRTSGGFYYQPPQPEEVDSAYGNPDIKAPRAWHGTIGYESDFRQGESDGLVLSTGFFYKGFDRLVINSTQFKSVGGTLISEKFNNDGMGRSFGWEIQLKVLKKPYDGWVSYTLSRSTRWDNVQQEQIYQYDQTHNINVVAGMDLISNTRISGRVRYVTGNPTTPVTSATFDADNDVYVPTRGGVYSERLSPFFQVDVRFDKRWIYDTWILTAYMDIENVSNAKNPESIRFSYDYSKKETISGLPILPTFGLKGEF